MQLLLRENPAAAHNYRKTQYVLLLETVENRAALNKSNSVTQGKPKQGEATYCIIAHLWSPIIPHTGSKTVDHMSACLDEQYTTSYAFIFPSMY